MVSCVVVMMMHAHTINADVSDIRNRPYTTSTHAASPPGIGVDQGLAALVQHQPQPCRTSPGTGARQGATAVCGVRRKRRGRRGRRRVTLGGAARGRCEKAV